MKNKYCENCKILLTKENISQIDISDYDISNLSDGYCENCLSACEWCDSGFIIGYNNGDYDCGCGGS